MARWSKAWAIGRIQKDAVLAEAVRLEPRLRPIIAEARAVKEYPGYNRVDTYVDLKMRAYSLVGLEAENRQLRTVRHYDAVMGAIDDLLPPDRWDRDEPDEEED